MKKAALTLAILACCAASPARLRAQERLNAVVTPVEGFREQFADNARRWPHHNSDTGIMGIVDGVYIHKPLLRETLTAQSAGADIRRGKAYYKLRIATKLVDGSGYYGLLFGIGNRANLNAFLIDGQGNYMVVERKNGVEKTLVSGKSGKINTGKGAMNVLSVQSEKGYLGYQVSYLVNGSNVQDYTAAEQAAADAAKKAEGEDRRVTITDAEVSAIFAGSLEPKGLGIGMLTKPGTVAAYDDLRLQTMPDKGDIVMYKNTWRFDKADAVFLKKSLLSEEEARLAEFAQADKKRAADALAKAQKEIAALSTAQRTPPGAGGKQFSPDPAAVVWLHDIIFQVGASSPFGFYPEKEKKSEAGGTTEYTILHRLPGIAGGAVADVEKGKGATLFIQLGSGLTEAQARNLAGQQLVNLCAAAGASTCQYMEADKADPALHMVGVYTGGKNFLSGRKTTAVTIPDKSDDGSWRVRMYMKAE